jgi:hypothetical protein
LETWVFSRCPQILTAPMPRAAGQGLRRISKKEI